MIASHNTMTYKSPKQWYLKPFWFLAQCQSKNYIEQYNQGVRAFDIRVFWNPDIEFRHGIFKYDASDIYKFLLFCNIKGIVIRLMLEDRGGCSGQELEFKNFCSMILKYYPNIKLYSGVKVNSGEVIYNFDSSYKENHYYSSKTSFFKSSNKYLALLDDWFPRLYAFINNKYNISEDKKYDNIIHLFDFI